MNIIEAFKTGKTVECHGEQWDTNGENSLIERITPFDILSDAWEVVEPEDEQSKICRSRLRDACAKRGISRRLAEALADDLFLKKN